MRVEVDENLVNGIAMTTAEKYQFDAFRSMDEVPEDEAREVVEMIRHLGSTLDVKNLRANKKIINAGRKVKQAEQEAAEKAKRGEIDQQELKDLREKQAVWIFTHKYPQCVLSPTVAEHYQKWATRNNIAIMSATSLEGWWLNSRAELLPKPPPPPAPPIDTGPKLIPLPSHLAAYEILKTKADVRALSVDELLKAQKLPEVRNRIAFILRNQL